MKITQRELLNGLMKKTYELSNSSVILEWKSLTREGKYEIKLEELSDDPNFYKQSYYGYSNLGWFFLVIGLGISFADAPLEQWGAFVVLALISFSLMLKKEEIISFSKKNGSSAFGLYHNNMEAKDFVDAVKAKLK